MKFALLRDYISSLIKKYNVLKNPSRTSNTITLDAQDQNSSIHQKEKLKLVRQEFNMDDNKTIFSFSDREGRVTIKSAQEISKDKNILNFLNQEDALNIGYIAGYEHSQHNLTE